ncbi:T9SS type A sorting domain-containing protein [Dawidia soli]|uniref:T9SS type A sorting domain-containing protein n=1 Tax=Dawidia soli TaxID=2782352 RepID=A0AAP2GE93_9BACT|nr:T9SS type A sorting domain-containing protein [Dawidia soli]MBT1688117.1 T9SS type A sorting domain-containing protein [Dawidia soli]
MRNFSADTELYAPQYSNPGQWGYILGQNHLYRQQFAEKYNVHGKVKIIGIIAYLAGSFENENNFVEFNVYSVGSTRLPDKKLASVQRLYKDLQLDGGAYYLPLTAPITVADSFYVTFNVQDYMHGGYDGDTLGLYCGLPGSRSEADLKKFGRNAVQAHNHVMEDWKDFYSQNFSPISTHFALFPVVEYSGQGTSTLKNHAVDAPLEVTKYNKAQGWGYILGHNYMYRQQYAERYDIKGNAEVSGIVTHLKGRYAHADTLAEFNVFNVSERHVPGRKLGGKKVPYGDLNVQGGTTTVLFDDPIAVTDSFYVSFNLFDYAHGGYEGDTIGLYMSVPGSRLVTDFKVAGRNVVQRHNHEFTDWVDFRTQNFTPFAVHFALYPIVTFKEDVPTGIEDNHIEQGGVRLLVPYPNPASEVLHIRYSLAKPSRVTLQVLDPKGNDARRYQLGYVPAENHEYELDVSEFPAGMYIYIIHVGGISLGSRFLVVH